MTVPIGQRRRDGASRELLVPSTSQAPDNPNGSIELLRDGRIPAWLRTGGSAGWRFLVIVGVVVVAAAIVMRLRVVLLPMILGLMIAAALAPPARWLMRHGWPDLLATLTSFLAAGAVVVGGGFLVMPSIVDGIAEIGPSLGDGYGEVRAWLLASPLGLTEASVQEFETTVIEQLGNFAKTQAPSRAALMLEGLAALMLTMVVSFFYVKDGEMFRRRLVSFFPSDVQEKATAAMMAGWKVLQRYLSAILIVGAVDATLIGIGLAIIGVPLVLPLVMLTFVAALFPLVGAILAGAVATLLALATGGPGDALLVLALTIAVQQLDGDIVAPAVFSRAVDLHPLTILLSLAVGAVLAGALGAFLAVPMVAVGMAVRESWRTDEPVVTSGAA